MSTGVLTVNIIYTVFVCAILCMAVGLLIKEKLKGRSQSKNHLKELGDENFRLSSKLSSLNSLSLVLEQLPDKSYITSHCSTGRECKRCKLKDNEGVIYENKKYRFRKNESKVWINTLLSVYSCSGCTYKSISMKDLVKYIGDNKVD